MNGLIPMEANPTEPKPELTVEARRAQRILMIAMAIMIMLPLLLFVMFRS
jgi:hypothetical protein